METLNNFSLICLMVGLVCGLVAWIASERERRDLDRLAVIRRITFVDARPLQYMHNRYPWQHDEWKKF